MNDRKTGIVAGFRYASDRYLEAVRTDLDLGCTLSDLRYIKTLFSSSKRDPSVTELYFCADALKKGSELPDSDIISEFDTGNTALRELFGRLSRDYVRYSGEAARLPACRLAEFAATRGELFPSGYSFGISRSVLPEAPAPSGSVAVFEAVDADDGFVLISSKEDPVSDFTGDEGILFYPSGSADILRFITALPSLVASLGERIQPLGLIPMTEKGLIRDLASVYSGGDIDIRAAAEASSREASPELLNLAFSPAAVITVPAGRSAEVISEAYKFGIPSTIIIRNAGRKPCFTIDAKPDIFEISPQLLSGLKYSRATKTSVSEEYNECNIVSLGIASDRSADISAVRIDDPTYDGLCKISARGGVLCVAGTVDACSGGALPMMIALDAWKRRCTPKIAACRFFRGNMNSVTVFILGAEGKPSAGISGPGVLGSASFWGRKITDGQEPDQDRDALEPALSGSPAAAPAVTGFDEFASHAAQLPGRGMIYSDISELCGSTPMLASSLELPAKLLYKLELFNPAGSSKDRVAISMLKVAVATGRLSPGGCVIEPTSGNTGIGLAAYGRHMGFRVIIVMPDSMSAERVSLIRAYGAETVLTPGADGMAGAVAEAERLRDSLPGSVILSQFDNSANPLAHYLTTGPEIWKDTHGSVDILVAGIGTGGTLCGTASYLKQMNPSLIAVGCEPASSPLIGRGYSGKHSIAGIGANFIPENFDRSVVDIISEVSDEEAREETRRLVSETGLLTGISSGCAAFKARKLAELPENEGKTVVAILPDTGEHYLSTGLFD